MNRLNILFFIIFISSMHNYFSQFNNIFLTSSLFLFLFELINVKFFNKNNYNYDSAVSDIVDEKESEETEENESEESEENESEESEESDDKQETDDKQEELVDKQEELVDKQEELVDKQETDDKEVNKDYINQIEIIRLLSNYDNLGDNGLMELKNKMQELDNLVELYRNDIKKMDDYDIIEDN